MRFEADTFKTLPLFQEANKTVTVLQLQYKSTYVAILRLKSGWRVGDPASSSGRCFVTWWPHSTRRWTSPCISSHSSHTLRWVYETIVSKRWLFYDIVIGYTLHVYNASCGNGYTLHGHSAGWGNVYVHPTHPCCWRWKGLCPAHP